MAVMTTAHYRWYAEMAVVVREVEEAGEAGLGAEETGKEEEAECYRCG